MSLADHQTDSPPPATSPALTSARAASRRERQTRVLGPNEVRSPPPFIPVTGANEHPRSQPSKTRNAGANEHPRTPAVAATSQAITNASEPHRHRRRQRQAPALDNPGEYIRAHSPRPSLSVQRTGHDCHVTDADERQRTPLPKPHPHHQNPPPPSKSTTVDNNTWHPAPAPRIQRRGVELYATRHHPAVNGVRRTPESNRTSARENTKGIPRYRRKTKHNKGMKRSPRR